MKPEIRVTMLGEFTISVAGSDRVETISLTGRSRRLWILTAYLIMHKSRGVSAQELIDLLWPDAEGINPVSTLQNNVSRARNALAEMGLPDARNLIQYENGCYRWAPDRKTELDCDRFEELMHQAKLQPDRETALRLGLEAVALYKGDFLADIAMEFWCVHMNSYYRSQYIRLCREVVGALLEEDRVAEAERICANVLQLNPAAEEFSVLMMRALIRGGDPKKALEHYEYICGYYRDEFGAVPGAELEAEKAEAVQRLYGTDVGLRELYELLRGKESERGALYCDNNVFREMVKLRCRELHRSHESAQILLLRLTSLDLPAQKHALYMKQMEDTITDTLRAGDPFTRVSASQFLVLLSGATPRDGQAVAQRICDRLRASYPRGSGSFSWKVLDLGGATELLALEQDTP